MCLRSLDVKLKQQAGRNFQVTGGRDIDAVLTVTEALEFVVV
jgi:hypothetical protein